MLLSPQMDYVSLPPVRVISIEAKKASFKNTLLNFERPETPKFVQSVRTSSTSVARKKQLYHLFHAPETSRNTDKKLFRLENISKSGLLSKSFCQSGIKSIHKDCTRLLNEQRQLKQKIALQDRKLKIATDSNIEDANFTFRPSDEKGSISHRALFPKHVFKIKKAYSILQRHNKLK